LGAAYLAGLATGYWGSQEEIADQRAVDHTVEPAMSDGQREALRQGCKRAVERSWSWV